MTWPVSKVAAMNSDIHRSDQSQPGAMILESYAWADATEIAARIQASLEAAGFRCFRPDGAYYIMTDITGFGFKDDVEFTRHLIRDIGVACVPGSSFYSRPELGAQQVRFCFCKRDETLIAAAERLRRLRS